MGNNIVLIGFMGCGKSTIGKLVAERLGYTFCDTDALIEQRENSTISQIFANKGEAYFRKLEHNMIREVSAKNCCVIATGGGVVLNVENTESLRKTGVVIYLDVTVETVLERLKNDTTRPLLMQEDKVKAISQMMLARKPLYTAAAHHVLDAGANSNTVVEQIIELYVKIKAKP